MQSESDEGCCFSFSNKILSAQHFLINHWLVNQSLAKAIFWTLKSFVFFCICFQCSERMLLRWWHSICVSYMLIQWWKNTHPTHCFQLNYGKAQKSLKAHGLLIPSYTVMHFWAENVKYVIPCLPQTFIALNILKIEDTFFIKNPPNINSFLLGWLITKKWGMFASITSC